MQQTFGVLVPFIQYEFSNKMEVINSNPVSNYKCNERDVYNSKRSSIGL